MRHTFKQHLAGSAVYSCVTCRSHIGLHEDIISKTFNGRHGRAYLFDKAVNVNVGPKENRYLMTGLHTVADVYCVVCQSLLGWKYFHAHEESQKYKEGRFVLEKAKIVEI